MNTTELVTTQGLGKYYNGLRAVDDLSLHIGRGRIVGLLGPNGSGKTTFIKLCNGLIQPTLGSVLIDGERPGPYTHSIVAYLPDHNFLNDWMKANDLMDFFADFYSDFDKVKAQEMLQRLSISPEAQLKTLSKGTKEKVQLIMTMSRAAQLYLLDEPIGGVDPATRDYILNTILTNYSENATVLLSTHLIADIERVLDEVIFLQNGRLVLQENVDSLRETRGKSVDAIFREVFAC